MGSNRMLEKIV